MLYSLTILVLSCQILNLASNNSNTSSLYYMDQYPSNHWALQPYTLNDAKVIALAYYKNSQYALYLNPNDKRGYRSIVRLINNDNMASTINRNYTSEERIGLHLLIALMTEVYNNIVPIAQNAVAGNNSHAFDNTKRLIKIGVPQEPSFLHGHIFGRGDPEIDYIKNVKLDGPVPGLIFDMRATTQSEAGNDKAIPWKEPDIKKVVTRLRFEIRKVQQLYTNQGITIFMNSGQETFKELFQTVLMSEYCVTIQLESLRF